MGTRLSPRGMDLDYAALLSRRSTRGRRAPSYALIKHRQRMIHLGASPNAGTLGFGQSCTRPPMPKQASSSSAVGVRHLTNGDGRRLLLHVRRHDVLTSSVDMNGVCIMRVTHGLQARIMQPTNRSWPNVFESSSTRGIDIDDRRIAPHRATGDSHRGFPTVVVCRPAQPSRWLHRAISVAGRAWRWCAARQC